MKELDHCGMEAESVQTLCVSGLCFQRASTNPKVPVVLIVHDLPKSEWNKLKRHSQIRKLCRNSEATATFCLGELRRRCEMLRRGRITGLKERTWVCVLLMRLLLSKKLERKLHQIAPDFLVELPWTPIRSSLNVLSNLQWWLTEETWENDRGVGWTKRH